MGTSLFPQASPRVGVMGGPLGKTLGQGLPSVRERDVPSRESPGQEAQGQEATRGSLASRLSAELP